MRAKERRPRDQVTRDFAHGNWGATITITGRLPRRRHGCCRSSGTDEEHAEAALIAAAGKNPERARIRRCRRISSPRCSASRFLRISAVLRTAPARCSGRGRVVIARDLRSRGCRKSASKRRGTARPHEPRRSHSVLEIVNDDMPFLVDSVLGELAERRLEVRFVVHPVFTCRARCRRPTDRLQRHRPAEGALRESFIHIHLERIDERGAARRDRGRDRAGARRRARLRGGLAGNDGARRRRRSPSSRPIRRRCRWPRSPRPIQFLEWLLADNFTFLGIGNYLLTAGEEALEPEFEPGLGLLRASELARDAAPGPAADVLTPEIRAFLNEPTLLIVTKAAIRSRVHRRVYMD